MVTRLTVLLVKDQQMCAVLSYWCWEFVLQNLFLLLLGQSFLRHLQ